MWGELAPPTAPQERLCHGNRVRIAKWGHPGRERSRSTAVGGPSGSLPADRPSTWKKGGRSVQAPVGTVEGDRGAIECWRAIRPLLGLGMAFLAGSIPFSNIAARLTRGVDLRGVANGTVSGTSLYRVAGFGPLAIAGVKLVQQAAPGSLVAQMALVPVLARTKGRRGALAGAAVLAPMLAKRLLGNSPPAGPSPGRVYLSRLLH